MKYILTFFCTSFLLFSCKNSTDNKNLIMRKWAYAYIEINGDKKDARSLNFPVIEFQSDNKYILNYAEITEEGTWNLKNDTLLSTTNKANNFTQDLIVLKLQNDTFRLKSANENDDLILTLTPFQVE